MSLKSPIQSELKQPILVLKIHFVWVNGWSYNHYNHTIEWPSLVRVAPVYRARSSWKDVLAHPMKTIYAKGYLSFSHTDIILILVPYYYWHLIEQRAGKWGRQLKIFNLSLKELDLHPSTLLPASMLRILIYSNFVCPITWVWSWSEVFSLRKFAVCVCATHTFVQTNRLLESGLGTTWMLLHCGFNRTLCKTITG